MGARSAAAAGARVLRLLNPEHETRQLPEIYGHAELSAGHGSVYYACIMCRQPLSRAKPHHSPLKQAHTKGEEGKGGKEDGALLS